jgi:hypothetical protein
MARAKNDGNGRVDRLEEAMSALSLAQANLVQTQAALAQQQTMFLARLAETDRINSERFARIETILMEHTRILNEHSRILRALPEAIRDKIGFKSPPTTPAAEGLVAGANLFLLSRRVGVRFRYIHSHPAAVQVAGPCT